MTTRFGHVCNNKRTKYSKLQKWGSSIRIWFFVKLLNIESDHIFLRP